ncbi:Uncharacterised protein [Mycobacterium tuberculosis]|uniref:Uncharacterized protein n=1 Tax=Mycobacterium tuberculosis TaxID=1773 RepID=A0A655IHN5_MYCTX|nr:Uncharacterised protein [Mycobacterium tuberculosis]CKT10064.1 Uncharacterised protein [Mycobacterium tuberculosis]COV91848.1 Uncharacterised protein [Mycobacterium tuberculosis]
MPLGVADIHPGQIGGEQRGFFAPLAGFDFQHNVIGIVRVTRCQHVSELGIQFAHPSLQCGNLGGERLVGSHQLARGLEVVARGRQLAVGCDDRGQSGKPAPDSARLGRIAVQRGICQRKLELGVFGEQHVNRLHWLRHVNLLPASADPNANRRPSCTAGAQFGRR